MCECVGVTALACTGIGIIPEVLAPTGLMSAASEDMHRNDHDCAVLRVRRYPTSVHRPVNEQDIGGMAGSVLVLALLLSRSSYCRPSVDASFDPSLLSFLFFFFHLVYLFHQLSPPPRSRPRCPGSPRHSLQYRLPLGFLHVIVVLVPDRSIVLP